MAVKVYGLMGGTMRDNMMNAPIVVSRPNDASHRLMSSAAPCFVYIVCSDFFFFFMILVYMAEFLVAI